ITAGKSVCERVIGPCSTGYSNEGTHGLPGVAWQRETAVDHPPTARPIIFSGYQRDIDFLHAGSDRRVIGRSREGGQGFIGVSVQRSSNTRYGRGAVIKHRDSHAGRRG